MGPVFAVDHQKLDSNYAGLGKRLAALGPIHSTETFNQYCRNACNVWREQFPTGIGATSPRFDELHRKIVSGDGLIIRTSWGGVVVTAHQPPRIEKFLVI